MEEKKSKKLIVGIVTIVIIAIIATTLILFISKKEEENAKQLLNDYISLINEKKYKKKKKKVASMNMSKEDFITRNKNIYEGIDSSNIKIEISDIVKDENMYKISYHQKMFTSAGEVEFDNTAKISKEGKELKIKWTSNLIFPKLGDTDKVRVSTIKSTRGTILDRNDIPLAEDGNIASVGIVPRKVRRK